MFLSSVGWLVGWSSVVRCGCLVMLAINDMCRIRRKRERGVDKHKRMERQTIEEQEAQDGAAAAQYQQSCSLSEGSTSEFERQEEGT